MAKNYNQKMISELADRLANNKLPHDTKFAKMMQEAAELVLEKNFLYHTPALSFDDLPNLIDKSMWQPAVDTSTSASTSSYTYTFESGWDMGIVPGARYSNAYRSRGMADDKMRPCPVCGGRATVYVYERSRLNYHDRDEGYRRFGANRQLCVRAECHGIVVEETEAGDVSRTLEQAWNMAVSLYDRDLGEVLDILAFGAGGFPVTLDDFRA